MENINYNRLESMEGMNIPETITLIGTGGFGGWVAFFAALSGVKKFILFNEGEVKDTDLARLPYQHNDIGKHHSKAMSDVITRFRPDTVVVTNGPFDPDEHAGML